MLQKEASARWNAYKYALILPVIVLFLYSFNVVEEIKYVKNKNWNNSTSRSTENEEVVISKFTTKVELLDLENRIESIVDLDYEIVSDYDSNGFLKNIAFNYKREGYEWSKGYEAPVSNETTLLVKFNGKKVTLEDDLITYFISDEDSLAFSNTTEELVYDITSATTNEQLEKYRKEIESQANYQLKFDDLNRDNDGHLTTISVSAKFPAKDWEKGFTLELAPNDLFLLMAQSDIIKAHLPKDKATLSINKDGSKVTTHDSVLFGNVPSPLDTENKINLPKDHTISFTIDASSTKGYLEEKKEFLKKQYDVDFDYSRLKRKKGKIVRIKISINDNNGYKGSQSFDNNVGIPKICISGIIKGDSKSWNMGDCKNLAFLETRIKAIQPIQDSIFMAIQQSSYRLVDVDSLLKASARNMQNINMDSLQNLLKSQMRIINMDSLQRSFKNKLNTKDMDSLQNIVQMQLQNIDTDSLISSLQSLKYHDPQNTHTFINGISTRPLSHEQINYYRIGDAKNPPLMILNGKEVEANIAQLIDPGLIENVSVLKNENATSLYGNKGKNGVILMTTSKKGLEESIAYNRVRYKADSTRAIMILKRGQMMEKREEMKSRYQMRRDSLLENREILKNERRSEMEEKRSAYEKRREELVLAGQFAKVIAKKKIKNGSSGYAYNNGTYFYVSENGITEFYNRWGTKRFTVNKLIDPKKDIYKNIKMDGRFYNFSIIKNQFTLSDNKGLFYDGRGNLLDNVDLSNVQVDQYNVNGLWSTDEPLTEQEVDELNRNGGKTTQLVRTEYRTDSMSKEQFERLENFLEDAGHTFRLRTYRKKNDRLIKLKFEINGSNYAYQTNKGVKELIIQFKGESAVPLISMIPFQ